ncbi:MAG: DUF58 domain-containing protein [Actinomycetaceae bacterium]|nr:DUF58 domain-containing protein [Actinomycetaceae bacterium]
MISLLPAFLIIAGIPILAVTGWLPFAYIWIALVLLVTFVDYCLAPNPTKVDISRKEVKAVRAQAVTESVLTLTYRGRRKLRGQVRDAWQPSAGAVNNRHRIVLPAQVPVKVTTKLHTSRRGNMRSDLITIRSWGPLRLAGRQVSFDLPTVFSVLPEFPSRRLLPGKLQKLQLITGRAIANIRGQGTEFDSLREWVDGDDVRSVDWRASARSNDLVVRTWRPERDRQIAIIMDTSRTCAARVGDTTRLEMQMDAALLLGAVAAKAGDHVSLLAGSTTLESSVLRPGPTTTLARFSKAMVDLEPHLVEADWARLTAETTRIGRKLSLLVLLTHLDPTTVAESMLSALKYMTTKHHVVIASVKDTSLDSISLEHESDAYVAAAHAHMKQRIAKTRKALSGMGVSIVESANLASDLTDHYLNLKARGKL